MLIDAEATPVVIPEMPALAKPCGGQPVPSFRGMTTGTLSIRQMVGILSAVNRRVHLCPQLPIRARADEVIE